MQEQFSRMALLVGEDAVELLQTKTIAIFGLGGVGSYVVEGLARAGIGKFILVDHDTVDITNINRQLLATIDTLGKYKVDLAKQRILSINPKASIETYPVFYNARQDTIALDNSIDYIIDAIDTVTAKLALIEMAKKIRVPILCSMGTGNKLDPMKFEIADISKTSVCPLAKVMRKELKKRNITEVKVLYSKEEPIKIENKNAKVIPGSISFVPSVAGLMIAGEVIKDLIYTEKRDS